MTLIHNPLYTIDMRIFLILLLTAQSLHAGITVTSTLGNTFQPLPGNHGIMYSREIGETGTREEPVTLEPTLLIGFAGYSKNIKAAVNWVDNLYETLIMHVRSDPEIRKRMYFTYLAAVRGPYHVGYNWWKKRVIKPGNLVRGIMSLPGIIESKTPVIVVAHSSGSHVAHVFFNELFKSKDETIKNLLSRIVYFNLDGSSGMYDRCMKKKVREDRCMYPVGKHLKSITCVTFENSRGRAWNHDAMTYCKTFSEKHKGLNVQLVIHKTAEAEKKCVKRKGRSVGSCLHAMLITARDPRWYEYYSKLNAGKDWPAFYDYLLELYR